MYIDGNPIAQINVTWHYKNTDPEFGSWQAAELQTNLEKVLVRLPVQVCIHFCTFEARFGLYFRLVCCLVYHGRQNLGDSAFIG
jgi:hypothetical protein